ncbi:MAG: septum formation inhibitor Maf [Actinobacteria bacterium]|jgi:septum formation protein|nr:septum formation inhibitor Maf [Actinomycetota bacterium]
MKIILASASPSRRRLLNSVGIDPEIIVSGVDEELPEYQGLTPVELVLALAIVKAHTVKAMINEAAIVIGCDSTFEFNGRSLGKPETPANAIARCKELRGNSGILHTGHCFIDTAKGMEISDITSTKVFFADMTDREIEDYVATGEPLQVAGGFTLDGLSAPFIDRIEGETSNVIGLSLPLLRKTINHLGYDWFAIANSKPLRSEVTI